MTHGHPVDRPEAGPALSSGRIPRMLRIARDVTRKLRDAGMPGKLVIVTTFDWPGYLYLSPGTVRNHLPAAIQKLSARNRAEAVAVGQRKGWL